MSDTEHRLWRALVELELLVKQVPAGGSKPDFRPLFGEIDALTRQLPPTAAPELLHYLHKKSYAKARRFLEGRDAENAAGNCGHQ